MQFVTKYFFIFLLSGFAWFLIYSIPTGKDENLLGFVHRLLNTTGTPERNERTQKEIDSEKVINALTNAFKP